MIIGFIGAKGSGKTLTQTVEAKIKQAQGYAIYSNYKLYFPYTIITPDIIKTMSHNDQKLERAIFLIDEMHLWMDSRKSISRNNRVISYFITQTRKKHIDLYYTTQFARQVDIRLKDNTDAVGQCVSKTIIRMPGKSPIVRTNYLPEDHEIPYARTWVRCKFTYFGSDNDIDKCVIKEYYANKYFNLYDTTEVISIPEDEIKLKFLKVSV